MISPFVFGNIKFIVLADPGSGLKLKFESGYPRRFKAGYRTDPQKTISDTKNL